MDPTDPYPLLFLTVVCFVQAKKEAEKLAKQMEELDDEFGVADLVTEKLKKDREDHYTAKNLRGMRVEHSSDHFR
jgi:hypothetical protein